jgi:hypothetical protein
MKRFLATATASHNSHKINVGKLNNLSHFHALFFNEILVEFEPFCRLFFISTNRSLTRPPFITNSAILLKRNQILVSDSNEFENNYLSFKGLNNVAVSLATETLFV